MIVDCIVSAVLWFFVSCGQTHRKTRSDERYTPAILVDVIVRENVCNTTKKRKKSRFWILKNVKKTYLCKVLLHSVSFS